MQHPNLHKGKFVMVISDTEISIGDVITYGDVRTGFEVTEVQQEHAVIEMKGGINYLVKVK